MRYGTARTSGVGLLMLCCRGGRVQDGVLPPSTTAHCPPPHTHTQNSLPQ